jgi:membrane-bound metal-dependent hydrolase YbcI (DUF457 family)
MFPGHFAAGLVLKAAEPRAPTLGLMVGVGLLDLVFGVAVGLGVEGGGFSHFETPWSHSLAMALVWSFLFAAAYWRLGPRVAAVMGLAVSSHWLLDLVSHNADMQLWPCSRVELGFGPVFGGLGGWLEILVTVAGLAIYTLWARRPENQHRRWGAVNAVIAVALGLEILVVRG